MVGISTDDVETLRKFREEMKAQYPLLSDKGGKVIAKYSGLVPVVGVANRANVVVGKDGKVKQVTEGQSAIDPTEAVNACSAKGAG